MESKALKGIVWVIIIGLIIWLIAKLVCSDNTKDFFSELNKEVRIKERKLNVLFAELKAASAKQVILDRVAKMKMDIITYCVLFLSIILSFISGFYHQDVYIGLYNTYKEAVKDMFIFLAYTVCKRIPCITMLDDLVGNYFREREYRRNGFDPAYLPVIKTKIETVKRELMELKNRGPVEVRLHKNS